MTIRRWMAVLMLAVGLAPVAIADAASRTQGPSAAIVTVQVSLHLLGYDPGLIDGLGGSRTVAAVAAYARDRGIVLNKATMDLVATLLRAEAREQLLTVGGAGKEAEPMTEEGLRMLPIQQW